MRLTSAMSSSAWNFSAPHPAGSPATVATSSNPAGSVSSVSSAGMLSPGSNPSSNRRASSPK